MMKCGGLDLFFLWWVMVWVLGFKIRSCWILGCISFLSFMKGLWCQAFQGLHCWGLYPEKVDWHLNLILGHPRTSLFYGTQSTSTWAIFTTFPSCLPPQSHCTPPTCHSRPHLSIFPTGYTESDNLFCAHWWFHRLTCQLFPPHPPPPRICNPSSIVVNWDQVSDVSGYMVLAWWGQLSLPSAVISLCAFSFC